MSEFESDHEGVSRSSVLLGLGAAAGAAAAVSRVACRRRAPRRVCCRHGRRPSRRRSARRSPASRTSASTPSSSFPPAIPRIACTSDWTGTKLIGAGTIHAGLPLPAGSIVYQVNTGYQGNRSSRSTSARSSSRRARPAPSKCSCRRSEPSPGGPFSSTFNLPNPIVIDRESTYTLSYFLSAGQAIFGATVGYLPPTQSFVPFTGGEPRVLDTRLPGPAVRQARAGRGEGRAARLRRRPLGGDQPDDHRDRRSVVSSPCSQPASRGRRTRRSTGPRSNQNIANGVITGVDGNGTSRSAAARNPTHVSSTASGS